VQVGDDGYRLVEALFAPDAPAGLAGQETVQILRTTWIQQFYRDSAGQPRCREKTTGLLPGKITIRSPYDTDARPGMAVAGAATRRISPRPARLTGRVSSCPWPPPMPAPAPWTRWLPAMTTSPLACCPRSTGSTPAMSASTRLAAADEVGVQLVGSLPPDTSWQAGDADAFDLTAIDFDARYVVCPPGKTSRNWQPAFGREGLPVIRATVRQSDWRACPDRPRCTRSKSNARHVRFLPRRQHEAQQRMRAPQSTRDWRERYALRCGIESLIHQASRRVDIHHARYRGKPKTFLQYTLTAMACNLVRLDAWLTGATTRGSWVSRLARLAQPLPTA
jgi:transposase